MAVAIVKALQRCAFINASLEVFLFNSSFSDKPGLDKSNLAL